MEELSSTENKLDLKEEMIQALQTDLVVSNKSFVLVTVD